jgi:periplasmic protein TonB
MKNQHKRGWGIAKIIVILLISGTSYGLAQTPKVPTYDNDLFEGSMIREDSSIKTEPVSSEYEKAPQFPGGESALMSFITKNIHYPPMDGCGIMGKVIIRFIITKSGAVSHVEVLRSLDPGCDKEAVRVIKLLPDFIPAEHSGVKVAVYYTIPVAFQLE